MKNNNLIFYGVFTENPNMVSKCTSKVVDYLRALCALIVFVLYVDICIFKKWYFFIKAHLAIIIIYCLFWLKVHFKTSFRPFLVFVQNGSGHFPFLPECLFGGLFLVLCWGRLSSSVLVFLSSSSSMSDAPSSSLVSFVLE